VAVLDEYSAIRDRLCPHPKQRSFFITTHGTRIAHPTIYLRSGRCWSRPGSRTRCRAGTFVCTICAIALLSRRCWAGIATVMTSPPGCRCCHVPGARGPGRDVLVLVRRAGAACARGRPSRAHNGSAAMTALAPTLEAFFTSRLITRKTSARTDRRLPRHVRLLLSFGATAHRQAAIQPRARRPRRHVDQRVPRPPRARPPQQPERTRNARLAAIHSMFRYAALRHPTPRADRASDRVPTKRFERAIVTYLTRKRSMRS